MHYRAVDADGVYDEELNGDEVGDNHQPDEAPAEEQCERSFEHRLATECDNIDQEDVDDEVDDREELQGDTEDLAVGRPEDSVTVYLDDSSECGWGEGQNGRVDFRSQ